MSQKNITNLIEKVKQELQSPKLPIEIRIKKEERLSRLQEEYTKYTLGEEYCISEIEGQMWFCHVIRVKYKHEFYIPVYNTEYTMAILIGLIHNEREKECQSEKYSTLWFHEIYQKEVTGQELYQSFRKFKEIA